MKDRSPPYILVAGNIGAGKTGLAEALGGALGATTSVERIEENPFFDRFYREPNRWAFASQAAFAVERMREQAEAPVNEPFVQDRSVFEAVEVFSWVLHAEGHLAADELLVLEGLAASARELARQPTLLVYLHAPSEQLLERIVSRGRAAEQRITADYLDRLTERYEQFVAAWSASPVLKVDTAVVDLREEGTFGDLLAAIHNAV